MTNTKTALYLDDVRTPIETMPGFQPWAVVRNYDEFVAWIKAHGIPNYVSLDHDLADEHMQDYFDYQAKGVQTVNYGRFTEKTGVDCLSYMLDVVYNEIEKGKTPNLETVCVHSHNPVGSENMLKLAANFAKHTPWKGEVKYLRHPYRIDNPVQP